MSILDDIQEVLSRGKKHGDYLSGRCPNPDHDDKNPSFLVYEDGYYCLSCGFRGHDLEKLLRMLDERSVFMEPEPALPPIPRVEVSEDWAYSAHRMLVTRPILGEYLTIRGIHDMIVPCQIGWTEGWFTFPVREADGSLHGITLCADAPTRERTGLRYVTPGQRARRYVPDWSLIPKADELFVVFGTIDAVILAQLGFAVVTSSGGKQSFDAAWLDNWRRPIYIVPDDREYDTARLLASRMGWRSRVVYLDYPTNCKDPADFVKVGTEKLVSQLEIVKTHDEAWSDAGMRGLRRDERTPLLVRQ